MTHESSQTHPLPSGPPIFSRDGPPQGEGEGEGDPEVARLGMKLDEWCLDLKRNVLVCIHSMYTCVYSFHASYCKTALMFVFTMCVGIGLF